MGVERGSRQLPTGDFPAGSTSISGPNHSVGVCGCSTNHQCAAAVGSTKQRKLARPTGRELSEPLSAPISPLGFVFQFNLAAHHQLRWA
jgi:hypothetical protein